MTPRARLAVLRDARYLAWSAVAAVVALVVFGVVGAIIPNPVFGRQIPAEPFAIVAWLVSAPIMGLLAGTYLVPAPASLATLRLPGSAAVTQGDPGATAGRTSALGYAGAVAVFLAIGCPVCNKIALLLLGASGALSIWAPLQPLVGLAAVALLGGSLAWRLRARARGGACPVA